ncbi:hypothetical protein PAXRUDRAFT_10369 [Paxillus rubicundulus Ve08.2h10]|uniref:Homeobox domain-containing protein n=1 Tax=Paxillus rubicundulus Ve08.2h10 TaxID=930991 RepID=A0A0D0EB44_9AGAM|nr:hypothetical protein PAXRUDRAFT_10369 [Paxillus rubicundulus Ve08.2h10]
MDPGMSAKPPTRPSLQSHADSLRPQSALYRVDLSSSTILDSNIPDDKPVLSPVNHQQMDPNSPPSHSRYPSTYIPSLMPPGVDPMSVDFRTFFPYIPNEVKHRKRTSRSQLKVLEDVFRKDTKPNASLRKQLAAQLDMSPRAVQVWFQNRRAKDKQLRKRASAAVEKERAAATSAQKSPSPRDTSPNDSSNSSTATEKPTHSAEDDTSSQGPSLHKSATESSPVTKIPCSPSLLCDSPPSAWLGSSGTPTEIPPHVRPLAFDLTLQQSDPYNTRRGSLPAVMPSQPMTGPDATQPPQHYPDRRKSVDVNFSRLVHHPFARFAKEKNEALCHPKSPLSPPGSGQATVMRSPSGVMGSIGPIRGTGHSAYSHPRPPLAHRASEPYVFASGRPAVSLVQESGSPLHPPTVGSRRMSENPMYAFTSRTLSSPIPGPLPTLGYQFGDPQSASPSNASPTPTDVGSPSGYLHSPEMAVLQGFSFPRSREADQDTEDSGSVGGLSRFGSMSGGSDSSVIYSDVSSCGPVDHMGYDLNARRGSCAPLEMRMSGLNMSTRSSQGSLNEAHLNAAAALSRSHRENVARQEHPSEGTGGYTSPASTATPGVSPHVRHVKDPGPSGLRSEAVYGYSPLEQAQGQDMAEARRGSIYVQESMALPHIYVQNSLGAQGPYSVSSDAISPLAQSTLHFCPGSGQSQKQPQHSHAGNFVPVQAERQYIQREQSNELQYPPDGIFQGSPNTIGIPHADASGYTSPANEYTYPSHAKESYGSLN